MSKGRAFGSQNYFSFILTIKYVSVSIILIMGVIKKLFLMQGTNLVEAMSLRYMSTVFPDYALSR